MAEEKNHPTIPESITINGVAYKVSETPELQSLIQSVAKVEKTKLYSQIEAVRKQVEALKDVQVTEGGSIDVAKLVDQLKGELVTKETLQEVVQEIVQPLLSNVQRTEKNELEAYREKLIKDNEATCIPELVKGNSKEELDAALQQSIQLRGKYSPTPTPQYQGDPNLQKAAQQQEFAQTPTPPQTPAPQAAPQIPTPPAVPQRHSPEATGSPEIKKMSMAEFAKNRENLQAQLQSMYGQ